MNEFRTTHSRIYSDAVGQGRVKFLKPGQSFDTWPSGMTAMVARPGQSFDTSGVDR